MSALPKILLSLRDPRQTLSEIKSQLPKEASGERTQEKRGGHVIGNQSPVSWGSTFSSRRGSSKQHAFPGTALGSSFDCSHHSNEEPGGHASRLALFCHLENRINCSLVIDINVATHNGYTISGLSYPSRVQYSLSLPRESPELALPGPARHRSRSLTLENLAPT